ncbi:MAG TPA: N-acetylmuramoyl-L-alanine amidase [Candidatus Fusicatenibacter intestinigallinarum]|uniref:N-acetylmuramoyl-L-alanine amidase n=1 Tax=Candidatus Fusicatenibacter intestinigallinarum TaxID=2838598 RepID=A0A9D2NA97_9FIRM|nr:N-acetylmuramoyl-L-alanine amidase [Candidatus Fusicatenibacter intestinigallinarum]
MQRGFFVLKRKTMEVLMAVLFLIAAYCLSREGAKLVENINGEKKTVVVDPGHGGMDPGKIGINDVEEKEINLEISLMLRDKLEKQGIQVVMTRETDQGLYDEDSSNKKVQDLQRRVELIHEEQPVCVVSIHQNSYPDASVKGAQVFYYEDSTEGKKLAEELQNALIAQVDPENHRQAKGNTTYYLLERTDVPLVICECGFLSNPEEAELLTDQAYQETLTDAIVSGILEYLGKDSGIS